LLADSDVIGLLPVATVFLCGRQLLFFVAAGELLQLLLLPRDCFLLCFMFWPLAVAITADCVVADTAITASGSAASGCLMFLLPPVATAFFVAAG